LADNEEKRAELFEHLAELRARLIRSAVYLVIGTAIAWVFYKQLFALLTRPMMSVLGKLDSKFLLTGFPEAFMIKLQVCMIAGLIIVCPFVTCEVWGFIAPGLTREEKKPVVWIAPLSVILFASGVALCYFIMPTAFGWFASFVPSGAELRPNVQTSLIFIIKMLAAFGVVFQLPVFLMFLAKVGIIDSKMLRANWRYAMVAVAVVAAVATPSADAFSMLMMGVPVAGLYFLSILLVKVVEGKPRYG